VTVLSFTITFHSPFRVGASSARDGVAAPVDMDDPLPADHLKGLMRAAAGQLLGDHKHPAIGQVFGEPRTPCPWSWSHGVPESPESASQPWPDPERRHRVAIDDRTHSAKKDQLVLAEQLWVPAARFTISKVTAIDGDERTHQVLLRCAAAGVHALGAWRRRGLGWVGITPDDQPVGEDDIALIQALRAATGVSR
jgi:hypothetical protein